MRSLFNKAIWAKSLLLVSGLFLALPAVAAQEIYLGREGDACSGTLSVKNKYGTYVTIPRGVRTQIDVAINGNGYWYWKCGSSQERSRGDGRYRQRVKRVYVTHSTEGRGIDWHCYDLID